MKKKSFVCCLLLLAVMQGYAQEKKKGFLFWKRKVEKVDTTDVKKDSLSKNKIKPYKEVITEKTNTSKGIFTVHELDDKYFLEIPDSLLGREILLINRISKGAGGVKSINEMFGYAGSEYGSGIIIFTKGKGDKLFLKQSYYRDVSKDSTENGLYRAVTNSNQPAILASLDIKTISPDSLNTVIEITDLLKKESYLFSLDSQKESYGLTALQPENSYINSIQAFPENVEIKTVKTYVNKDGGHATFELNNSMVLLPKKPMLPRYSDGRVGFFPTSYNDYDADPQGVKTTILAKRWRLEPKEADIEKYKRGELVEPKKPIVFYIDPATPKKWVPYLIQGINDWQAAFEQAGFKNAIYAKEVTEKDSTWSLNDARHSTIVYMASPVPNAMGPSTSDPRSGEILESHVFWYHNVMKLVKNWYIAQAGAIDSRAHNMEFDDELMGQLIRFVSSHEIGHAIGLMHNFGASSTVPVEKLRDKVWVEKHGHTPSIMDYARFNYVAQPEDNIGPAGIYPRIGDYDRWAIQWGYRWYPEVDDAKEERLRLRQMVTDSIKSNSRLWFGPQEFGFVSDPRNQAEVLSDNPMKANAYGIKNLKRILPQIESWAKKPGEGYEDLRSLYNMVTSQYARYLYHAIPYLGTNYITNKLSDQEGPVYAPVDKKMSKEAIAFLNKYAFRNPEWLFNKEIFGKAFSPGSKEETDLVSLGADILSNVISPIVIPSMLNNTERYGRDKTYTVEEMLGDIERGIWSELRTQKPIDRYRRKVQKRYVTALVEMGKTSDSDDAALIANISLKSLKTKLKKAIPKTRNRISRAHLERLVKDIEEGLDPPKVVVENKEKKTFWLNEMGRPNNMYLRFLSHSQHREHNCYFGLLDGNH